MSAYLERFDFTLGRDLVLVTVGFTAYLLSFRIFGGVNEIIADCPRYTWWNAFTYQLFIFPLFCFLSYKEISETYPNASFIDKMLVYWPEGPRENSWPMSRMWLLCFFGYMTKDMVGVYKIGPMYYLHHFVCIYLALTFLLLDVTPFIMIVGGTVAETGSACINGHSFGFATGKPWLRYLFLFIMTCSNLFVIWELVPFNRAIPSTGPTCATFWLTIVVNLLCVERERQALMKMMVKETFVPGAKGKPDKVIQGEPIDIPIVFSLIGATAGYFTVTQLALLNK
jgi:hypothetical protein